MNAKSEGRNTRLTLNNNDRSQWVDNDEGLYSWWKSTKLSKRKFIQENRAEIDSAIFSVLTGKKPAHYLVYGG